MAVKKFRFRPEGLNDYSDILHPETSADVVLLKDTAGNFSSNNVEGALAELNSHLADHDHPYAPDYGIATQAQAEAGTINNKYMTPLRVKNAIQKIEGDAGKIKGIPVDITGLADGKTLKYDAANAKWTIDFSGIGWIYNAGQDPYNIYDYSRTTVTKYQDRIEVVYDSTSRGSVLTGLAVDLTNTDVVYFDISNEQISYKTKFYCVVMAEPSTIYESALAYVSMEGEVPRHAIGVDVSNLKGSYIIGILFYTVYTSAHSVLTIYKIWGE